MNTADSRPTPRAPRSIGERLTDNRIWTPIANTLEGAAALGPLLALLSLVYIGVQLLRLVVGSL